MIIQQSNTGQQNLCLLLIPNYVTEKGYILHIQTFSLLDVWCWKHEQTANISESELAYFIDLQGQILVLQLNPLEEHEKKHVKYASNKTKHIKNIPAYQKSQIKTGNCQVKS